MKLNIVEHSGDIHVTEVENYNALETFNQLRAAQSIESNEFLVVIGDVIIDSRSVKLINPVNG